MRIDNIVAESGIGLMNASEQAKSPDRPAKSGKEPTYEAYEVVTMFARYTGAWQEYSQRINARHQIINMWLTASTGLMIFFSQEKLEQELTIATSIAIPALASVTFSLLMLHDLIMARLSDFMRVCEGHNNGRSSVTGDSALPGYRTDRRFSANFHLIRSLQNHVLTAVALVLWFGTIVIDRYRHADAVKLPLVCHYIIGGLWMSAIMLNYGAIVYRYWREVLNHEYKSVARPAPSASP